MMDPILLFFLANALLFYGLAYVPPTSKARILLFLLIIPCCLISVRSKTSSYIPSGVGREYIIGFILHANHWLNLAKLEPTPNWSASTTNVWALNQVIGARWGIAWAPPFHKKNPSYVPSRLTFIFTRLWDLLWTSAIIWFLRTYPLNTERIDYLEVPNGFLTRLGDLTEREVIIRVHASLTGYLTQYCSIRACHSLASCVGVLCGQDPKQWPPLFGSIADAYTIRGYFATFWHRLMRKAFTAHAIWLADALHLPKHNHFTRSIIIAMTFMLSAVMHIVAAPRHEVCSAWPQIRYYTAIIVAIFLEDTVIGAFKWMTKSRKAKPEYRGKGDKAIARAYPDKQTEQKQPHILLRLVGYVWVLCFHIWAGSMIIFGFWTHCFA